MAKRLERGWIVLVRVCIFAVIFLLINSCSQLPFGEDRSFADITKATAKKVLESQLKDLVLKNAPILPSTENPFSIIEKLPGGVEFEPNLKNQPKWSYNEQGEMLLSPGDYIIPVWTFCLDANSKSPEGYIYTLNRLHGSATKIIQRINLKALPKYQPKDIQMLIWALQAGLAYDEMTSPSQIIIDNVAAEFKQDLQKSFYRQLEEKWNHISDNSQGLVPRFSEASDEFLMQIGSVGEAIIEVRILRQRIINAKNNYEFLRRAISTQRIQQHKKATQWSQISERVYARFITSGHYQEAGRLQIRVVSSSRQTAGTGQKDIVAVDMSGIIADSGSAGIQSLSLVPLVGFGGVAVAPTISSHPYTIAAVMAAILASKVIDWDMFYNLANKFANSTNQFVKDMIEYGNEMLNEKFSENEKELKDNKIISGKNKSEQKSQTRQYEKSGDERTLNEDFDRLPGEKKDIGEGKEIKEMPSGRKAIKRPRDNKQLPTLEIQPAQGSDGVIKVRYRK